MARACVRVRQAMPRVRREQRQQRQRHAGESRSSKHGIELVRKKTGGKIFSTETLTYLYKRPPPPPIGAPFLVHTCAPAFVCHSFATGLPLRFIGTHPRYSGRTTASSTQVAPASSLRSTFELIAPGIPTDSAHHHTGAPVTDCNHRELVRWQ